MSWFVFLVAVLVLIVLHWQKTRVLNGMEWLLSFSRAKILGVFVIGALVGQLISLPAVGQVFLPEPFIHLYPTQKAIDTVLFVFPMLVNVAVETTVNATCPPVTGVIANWPHTDCDIRAEHIRLFTLPLSFGLYYGFFAVMLYLVWIGVDVLKKKQKMEHMIWRYIGMTTGIGIVYGLVSSLFGSFCLVRPSSSLCVGVVQPYPQEFYLYGFTWPMRMLLLPFEMTELFSGLTDQQSASFELKTVGNAFWHLSFLPIILTGFFFFIFGLCTTYIVKQSRRRVDD